MASSTSWEKIFGDYDILNHNFNVSPYILTAEQIKKSCQNFRKTTEKEVRILCKQDSREDRPNIFEKEGLFILPVKNGEYAIIRGEGYVDIPEIKTTIGKYKSKLDFKLESSLIGNSEMQHLDFAYASSLIRTFIGDDSLVLTIRGRKYTPQFSFRVGSQTINVESVQTEVDAGYEGRDKIILVEAKNSLTKNTIIRQLFYPFKQWKSQTTKKVLPVFFERQDAAYNIWQYTFTDENDYNSIRLVKSSRYEII
jgi:deoxycytidine triphosphate deaminase